MENPWSITVTSCFVVFIQKVVTSLSIRIIQQQVVDIETEHLGGKAKVCGPSVGQVWAGVGISGGREGGRAWNLGSTMRESSASFFVGSRGGVVLDSFKIDIDFWYPGTKYWYDMY